LLIALLTVALTGCETTAQKSAALAKRFRREQISQVGLRIGRVDPDVQILATALVRGEEASAAVVTLRNDAGGSLADVPLAIAVHAPTGRVVYQNDAPGLEPALTSVPALPPHQIVTWVDDQLPASAGAGTLTARAGEPPSPGASPPRLRVAGAHVIQSPSGGQAAQGTVLNSSAGTVSQVVVFATVTRGGRVVAAGRALLSDIAPGASSPFEAFLLGDPRGGELHVSAAAPAA
jgi:hypothetical protein